MRFLYLLVSIAVAVSGCSDQNNSISTKEKNDTIQTAISSSEVENNLDDATPYTEKEIAALLPAQLEGGKLSEPDSGEIMGTHYAKGLYTINDSTAVELSLFDCAGSSGAGFYQFQFLNMLNTAPESEDVEKKTIDFNGQKAIQQLDNNSYRSTFTYPSGRLLVTLESEALDTEGLKKIAEKLSFK